MPQLGSWGDVTRMFLMLLLIVGSAILVLVVVVAISDRTSRYERPDWLPRAVEITVTPADTR